MKLSVGINSLLFSLRKKIVPLIIALRIETNEYRIEIYWSYRNAVL